MERNDLRDRVLAFLRRAAPFAYCDACLALRVDAPPVEVGLLVVDVECERRRRACYGCRRTLELTGWPTRRRDREPSGRRRPAFACVEG